MEKGIYKKADGVIYTEQNEPEKIKYLKIVNSDSKSYYTLYGNDQQNAFECAEDKKCVMYGDGDNDYFSQTNTSQNFRIKDFNRNDDKIILYGGINELSGTKISVKYHEVEKEYYIKVTGASIVNTKKLVFLPRYSYEEIDGWIDMINNPENHEIQDRLNNPIKIK